MRRADNAPAKDHTGRRPASELTHTAIADGPARHGTIAQTAPSIATAPPTTDSANPPVLRPHPRSPKPTPQRVVRGIGRTCATTLVVAEAERAEGAPFPVLCWSAAGMAGRSRRLALGLGKSRRGWLVTLTTMGACCGFRRARPRMPSAVSTSPRDCARWCSSSRRPSSPTSCCFIQRRTSVTAPHAIGGASSGCADSQACLRFVLTACAAFTPRWR